MRVLHLIKTPTGATWAVNQIGQLLQLGVEVHVAIPEGLRARELRQLGARVHVLQTDIAIANPAEIARRIKALRAVVSQAQPDLIHSHFVGTTITARLAFGPAGVPRLFQVPGPLHLEFAVPRQIEISTARSNDWWMPSCRWSLERYLAAGVPLERVHLSHYGIPIGGGARPRTGCLRREIGVSSGTPLMGMVAYFYPPKRLLLQRRGIKGHEDFIDAIRLLARSVPRVRAVVVGGPAPGARHYMESVIRNARNAIDDRVIFLGSRTDVPNIYPDFDVAVFPSLSENVGGAPEAQLAGVPTVATEVGGLPDAVTHQKTGLLVPSNSPSALSAAMESLLQNPARAKSLASAGREHAMATFDLRRTAMRTGEIYDHVLRQSRKSS